MMWMFLVVVVVWLMPEKCYDYYDDCYDDYDDYYDGYDYYYDEYYDAYYDLDFSGGCVCVVGARKMLSLL